MKAARLFSIARDMNEYVTGVHTFTLKYNYLPGDYPNATDIWGSQTICPTGPGSPHSVVQQQTCNGDGNGSISDFVMDDVPDYNTVHEWYTAWQHLANAGFIKGLYSGSTASFVGCTTGDANMVSVLNVNIPRSKYPSVGYSIHLFVNDSDIDGQQYSWAYNWGHVITAGGVESCWGTSDGALTSHDVYLLDSKFDDGFPAKGMFLSNRTLECVTSLDPVLANYYKDRDTARDCVAVFRLGMKSSS